MKNTKKAEAMKTTGVKFELPEYTSGILYKLTADFEVIGAGKWNKGEMFLYTTHITNRSALGGGVFLSLTDSSMISMAVVRKIENDYGKFRPTEGRKPLFIFFREYV